MQYEITFTQQELAIVYAGLGKLPLEVALQIFGKIQEAQRKKDEESAVPIEKVIG